MDYFETLRRGGWLPDPSDRVRVVIEHGATCPSRFGSRCRCVPRLILAESLPAPEDHGLEATEHAS